MIKVGIIGATGYAGAELVRILMNHKEVEIKWYGSRSYVGQQYADIYQNMFQLVDADCMDDQLDELIKRLEISTPSRIFLSKWKAKGWIEETQKYVYQKLA